MLEEKQSLCSPYGQIYLVPLLSAAWQPFPFLFIFAKCSHYSTLLESRNSIPCSLLLCVLKHRPICCALLQTQNVLCWQSSWLNKNSPLKNVVTLITF